MKRTDLLYRISYWGTPVVALIAAACLTVSYLTSFDADVGYFASDAVLPRIAAVVALLFAGYIVVLSAAVIKRGGLEIPAEDTLPMRGIAVFAAVVLVGYAVYGFLTLKQSKTEFIHTLRLLRSLFALLSAGYFACVAGGKKGGLCNAASVCVLFCGILILATTYFDYFTPMNGPVKVPLQFGAICFLISFLFEIRLRIGGGYARPRAAYATALISSLVCVSASVPVIIAQLSGILDRPDYALTSLLLLSLGVYGFLRAGGMRPVSENADSTADAGTIQ